MSFGGSLPSLSSMSFFLRNLHKYPNWTDAQRNLGMISQYKLYEINRDYQ